MELFDKLVFIGPTNNAIIKKILYSCSFNLNVFHFSFQSLRSGSNAREASNVLDCFMDVPWNKNDPYTLENGQAERNQRPEKLANPVYVSKLKETLQKYFTKLCVTFLLIRLTILHLQTANDIERNIGLNGG